MNSFSVDCNGFPIFKEFVNKTSQYQIPDHPNEWLQKDFPIQDFDYRFNSWGFRGPDYSQYVGKSVNIALGDSFTVNIGGPINHSWASILSQKLEHPVLNFGMTGAGNDAINSLYKILCKLFNIQNCFVQYSFFHRRLIDNRFSEIADLEDSEYFKAFTNHRIENAYECSVPFWCHTPAQHDFLRNNKIAFFPNTMDYKDHRYTVDSDRKKYIDKTKYNMLAGSDWPTYREFVEGSQPNAEQLTSKWGSFLKTDIVKKLYTNRDNFHCSFETNKNYAESLLAHMAKKNES